MHAWLQDGPEERGARLVAALTELSAASSSAGGASLSAAASHSGAHAPLPLLTALATRYGLAAAVASAIREKLIALDEAQLDYTMALLGEAGASMLGEAINNSAAAARPGPSAGAQAAQGGGAGPSGSGSSGGFGARTRAMDPAKLASLVSQVGG